MVILITQVAAGLVIYFQKEVVSVSYCVSFPWSWSEGNKRHPEIPSFKLKCTVSRHNWILLSSGPP